MATSNETKTVAIIGSGIIGRNWAMVFLSGRYKVRLFDIDIKQVGEGMRSIKNTLRSYAANNIIRGELSAEEQCHNITTTAGVKDCVDGADIVLECVPENLEIKQGVFRDVDEYVGDHVILASATAGIFPSKISKGLQHAGQVIATHPLNPPYFIPLVEVVPAPWTRSDITQNVMSVMRQIGQEPVLLLRETEGFVIGRIQHALTAQCWKLVRDGVVTPEDIDKVMPYGLGRRYAFLGVLEASHLNAYGIKDFFERYGDNLYKLQTTFGPAVKFEGQTLDLIHNDIASRIPVEKINEKAEERDKHLAALGRFLKEQSNAI